MPDNEILQKIDNVFFPATKETFISYRTKKGEKRIGIVYHGEVKSKAKISEIKKMLSQKIGGKNIWVMIKNVK